MSKDETENSQSDLAHRAVDSLEEAITGIPAEIRKGAWDTLKRLSAAIISIPVSKLEGRAAEEKASTDARVLAIKTVGDKIAARIDVDPIYAEAISTKYAEKIVRQQINKDKIVAHAIVALKERVEPTLNEDPNPVSEDFLNSFEAEAENIGTEQMQRLFGRILAGEINKPGTFSIRTVRLMAQLDNFAAALFVKFCSCCVAIPIRITNGPTIIRNARLPSIGRSIGANDLEQFGFTYDNINVLAEYGLLLTELNSYNSAERSIWAPPESVLLMQHGRSEWVFVRTGEPQSHGGELRLEGPSLSQAGRELYQIVDIEENNNFTQAIKAYYRTLGYEFKKVEKTPDGRYRLATEG